MLAGRVGRAHGLDGSFYVVDPVPGVIAVGVAFAGIGKVVGVKGTGERPIVRLDTVSDRTAAEALRGSELIVPDEARPPLGEDEYWAEELVGCRVVAGERVLGTVTEMLALPSCEALVLDGSDIVVPLVRDAIERVDVEARAIFVDGGFLGLAD